MISFAAFSDELVKIAGFSPRMTLRVVKPRAARDAAEELLAGASKRSTKVPALARHTTISTAERPFNPASASFKGWERQIKQHPGPWGKPGDRPVLSARSYTPTIQPALGGRGAGGAVHVSQPVVVQ